MDQKPKIGLMVHYVCVDSSERPAVIVRVIDKDDEGQALTGVVALLVFDISVPYPVQVCFHNEEKKEGTWHWPEQD